MPVVRRRLAVGAVALLLGAPALAGCTGDDGPPKQPAAPQVTSLGQLQGKDVHVVRAGFCPRVAPRAVERALGGAADTKATWSNGDRAQVTSGAADVVHEYGCSWTAADGTVARTWVFAPPVGADRADELAQAATKAPGCAPVADAADFGTPSAVLTCTTGGRSTTAYQGLFGDAWLSCSLETAATPEPARVDRWCATVLQAASS